MWLWHIVCILIFLSLMTFLKVPETWIEPGIILAFPSAGRHGPERSAAVFPRQTSCYGSPRKRAWPTVLKNGGLRGDLQHVEGGISQRAVLIPFRDHIDTRTACLSRCEWHNLTALQGQAVLTVKYYL